MNIEYTEEVVEVRRRVQALAAKKSPCCEYIGQLVAYLRIGVVDKQVELVHSGGSVVPFKFCPSCGAQVKAKKVAVAKEPF
jgi:hypothetical protein